MHYPLKIRKEDGNLLLSMKEVTRLTGTEIASQSLSLFFDSLSTPQKEKILKHQNEESK